MTELKRGMIIDVNLDPTLGSETEKIRPCVIVTDDDMSVCFVTDAIKP